MARAGRERRLSEQLRMMLVITLTSFALISLMFLLMVRVTDPLLPRATFGVLNTVLYFPSGAVYPQAGFPGWMQAISTVLPFTHGIEAARDVADGATLSDVADLLAAEAAIGVVYATIGYLFIRNAERLSLRHATLDRA